MHNLPNLLTALRLVAGLAIVPLIVWPGGALWGTALILFVLAALTDWIDGALARRFDAESALGRLLDPLADKIAMLGALTGLALGGVIAGGHGIAMVAILAREIMISGARDFLAQNGHALPVSPLSKWKTAAQLAAAALLLGGAAISGPAIHTLGLIVLWAAAALSVWTGLDYGRTVWRVATKRENAP